MTTSIPQEPTETAAAPHEGPCPETERKACDRQGQACPKGRSRQESHRSGPTRQQNGQSPRSAETAWRRYAAGTREGDLLAGALSPGLLEHPREEDGDTDRVLQKRRGRALLPSRLQVIDSASTPPAPLRPAAFLSPTPVSLRHARTIPAGGGWLRRRRSGLYPHHHHQIEHPMFSPAAQPADLPVVEARAQRHRSAKPQVFRFQFHGFPIPLWSTHSCLRSTGFASGTGLASPVTP